MIRLMTLICIEIFSSFLHAKLFGEHNHLVSDPWSRSESVYWVSGQSQVWRLSEDGDISMIWSPADSARVSCYNQHLVFIGVRTAVMSDGAGRLVILDTGHRHSDTLVTWRTMFSDEVCGRDRPFVVTGGEVSDSTGEVEVVVQYVEETETKGFINVLEWISFSLNSADNSYMMERVRRVRTRGGVNMVSLVSGRLVTSCQKEARIVFDSMAGEEEITDADMEAVNNDDNSDEKTRVFWTQTDQDIELWCYLTEIVTKDAVKISLDDGDKLEIRVGGDTFVSGQLKQKVESDSWTWTFEGGKIGVMMSKEEETLWPGDSLWSEAGGSKSEEVKDVTEAAAVLANMTSDVPVVGDEGAGSTFNSEQLEECDDCDDRDTVYWLGGDQELQVSLSGHQQLCNISLPDSSTPAIIARHDVDGLVWRLGQDNIEHVATFPALGYVQASKTNRKYMSASPTWNYSVISDNSRHLYIYRQPQSLAAETELRNRKSGQVVSKVAKQQVVTLDSNKEILGLAALTNSLVVITEEKLFRVHIV